MYYDDVRLDKPFLFIKGVNTYDLEHDTHIHDHLEVFVVLENELHLRMNSEHHLCQSGDAVMCRPFEPHWGSVGDSKPATLILLFFTPYAVRHIPLGHQLLVPFYTTAWASPIFAQSTSLAQSITASMIEAVNAQEQLQPGWEIKQFLCFTQILYHIYTHFSERYSDHENLQDHHCIVETIRYTLSHYTEDIKVSQLGELAGLGKTQFYQRFKKLTGLAPGTFINRLRIQSALDYLSRTDLSVLETAYASGFQCLSSFNKHFKNYTGTSPREYRALRGTT